LDLVPYDATFDYHNVTAEKLDAFYETNVFKIRCKEGEIFGTLKDVDG